MNKIIINPQYNQFRDTLLNIETIFSDSNESIHKARNELKVIQLNQLQCVVKSFKIPHIINRIAYTFFRDGKAKKSFINAMKLKELRVNTPEPIGVIEFFEFGLLKTSYFISKYEPYDFTIREVFHHKVDNVEQILKEFARFTYEIHQKGVWHVDYSLGNILISKQTDGTYSFSLVDINRMEFKDISPKEGLKNFNKFWAKYDEDLPIIAKEYAKLAKFDEEIAVEIVLKEAKVLEDRVTMKRKIKGQK
ncbi:lipopolysaccharide kinase InaA family protein [Sulfurimonas sp.]